MFSENSIAQSGYQPLASTMQELQKIVNTNAFEDRKLNERRIIVFTEKRDQQRQLLQQENTAIAEQEQISEKLNNTINNNDEALKDLEQQLALKLGNFGELFGVTRQVAGDTRAQIANSIISAEFPNREDVLETIATSKELPTIAQLRALWAVLLQEQIQQGRVSRFTTIINDAQGLPREEQVIRLGPFVAVANGKFLTSTEDSYALNYLPNQPASNFLRSAQALSAADPGDWVDAAIDPSRGVILGLLVQMPSLEEQFRQGGLTGYLVTALAIIGIAIALQRLFSLWRVSSAVQRQMRSEVVDLNNPLGRVLNTYHDNPDVDIETLELKLDDAVLKEVPKFDRGLNTVKVLAAVAPLMGLLGTVTGMILTFQTITLWGTGDPKLMADGISQALITTVQGLVAAIPLLLLHSIANGRARVLQQILEEQSAGLIAAKAEGAHSAAMTNQVEAGHA